jgi:hypothetical protein
MSTSLYNENAAAEYPLWEGCSNKVPNSFLLGLRLTVPSRLLGGGAVIPLLTSASRVGIKGSFRSFMSVTVGSVSVDFESTDDGEGSLARAEAPSGLESILGLAQFGPCPEFQFHGSIPVHYDCVLPEHSGLSCVLRIDGVAVPSAEHVSMTTTNCSLRASPGSDSLVFALSENRSAAEKDDMARKPCSGLPPLVAAMGLAGAVRSGFEEAQQTAKHSCRDYYRDFASLYSIGGRPLDSFMGDF